MSQCTIRDCPSRSRSAKFGLCGKHYRQKFGVSFDTERNSWAAMKSRCNNPNDPAYKNYGGRGIKVCPQWNGLHSTQFVKDMGPKPSPKHSIERLDTNGDYEPSNCVWSTPHEQANNKRGVGHPTGIYYQKQNNRWFAFFMIDGKIVLRKAYKDKDQAIACRQGAEIMYYAFHKEITGLDNPLTHKQSVHTTHA